MVGGRWKVGGWGGSWWVVGWWVCRWVRIVDGVINCGGRSQGESLLTRNARGSLAMVRYEEDPTAPRSPPGSSCKTDLSKPISLELVPLN